MTFIEIRKIHKILTTIQSNSIVITFIYDKRMGSVVYRIEYSDTETGNINIIKQRLVLLMIHKGKDLSSMIDEKVLTPLRTTEYSSLYRLKQTIYDNLIALGFWI